MVVAFVQDLWDSIFEPGATPAVVRATHLSFTGLVLTLLVMLYVTGSYHFLAMLVLSICLWFSVAWFITEYTVFLEQKRQDEVSADNTSDSPGGSATTSQRTGPVNVNQRTQAQHQH